MSKAKPRLMKWPYRILFFATLSLASTSCNKNETRMENELPAITQKHLQNCTEGCKTFVQLVSLNETNYYYLGIKAILCDPTPNRVEYHDLDGNLIDPFSDLHKQLASNKVMLDEIWNCE